MNDLANSPMTTTSSTSARIDFNTPELQRKRRLRALKDHLTRWYVFVGGLAVLATITYPSGDVVYVSGLTKLASINDIVNLVESVTLS